MKVAVLTPLYYPYVGGITVYSHNLAHHLAKLGHEVHIIANQIIAEQNGQTFPDMELKNVMIKRLKAIRLQKSLWIAPTILKTLIQGNYDVIDLQLIYPWGAEMAVISKLIKKAPIVSIVHNYFTRKQPLTTFYERFIQHFLFRRFDAVVGTTKFATNRISHHERVYVDFVPLGIADTFFDETYYKSVQMIQKLGRYLLFVGGFGTEYYFKGVDILIKAFKDIKKSYSDLSLIFVGTGSLIPKYQQLSKELGVDKDTHFIGAIENSRLPPFYYHAELLVLPSVAQETTGMPLVEAMACGTPVVCTDLPTMKEVVGKFGVIAKRGDHKSLASAIAHQLNRSIDISKMRNHVKELYSWKSVAASIDKINKRVLSQMKK